MQRQLANFFEPWTPRWESLQTICQENVGRPNFSCYFEMKVNKLLQCLSVVLLSQEGTFLAVSAVRLVKAWFFPWKTEYSCKFHAQKVKWPSTPNFQPPNLENKCETLIKVTEMRGSPQSSKCALLEHHRLQWPPKSALHITHPSSALSNLHWRANVWNELYSVRQAS